MSALHIVLGGRWENTFYGIYDSLEAAQAAHPLPEGGEWVTGLGHFQGRWPVPFVDNDVAKSKDLRVIWQVELERV